MADLLAKLLSLVKEQLPALVMFIFNRLKAKISRAEAKNKQLELALKIKENHEKIDKDNAGKPDSAIVDDMAGKSSDSN